MGSRSSTWFREAMELYNRFATTMDKEGRRGLFKKYSRAKMLKVQEKFDVEFDAKDLRVILCSQEHVTDHQEKKYVVTSWIEIIDKTIAEGYVPKEKYRLHVEPCKHVPPGLCVVS